MKKLLAIALAVFSLGFMQTAKAQTFQDVGTDSQYHYAVEQLVELGVFTKNNNFNPHKNMTRGQLAKTLAITLDLDTTNVKNPGFKDVPTTHEFYPYIAALVQQGIVSGYPDGTYGIHNNVTRGQMAKFIVNGFQLPKAKTSEYSFDKEIQSAEVLANANTLAFYYITTAETFHANKPVTRGQVALFLSRTLESIHLDDVRIPYTQFTHGMEAAFDDIFTFAIDVNTRMNEATKEIYFDVNAPGQHGFYLLVGEQEFFYEIDVLDDLTIDYREAKDGLRSPYHVMEPFVYNAYNDDIASGTFTRLHGGEPVTVEAPLVYFYEEEQGASSIEFHPTAVGEVWRLDVTLLDGTTEKEYFYAPAIYETTGNNSRTLALSEFKDKVYVNMMSFGEGSKRYELLSGDASAFLVEYEEATDYTGETFMEPVAYLTKPGRYVIQEIYEDGFTETFEYIVFEVDGMLASMWLYDLRN